MRKFVLGFIGLVGVCLLFLLASCGDTTGSPLPATTGGTNSGSIGDKLTTPDGVAVVLIAKEQVGTRLFFHFHLQNGSKSDIKLFGSSDIYQFRIPLAGAKTVVTIPTTTDYASTYPPLTNKIAASKTADGWVMIDTSSIGTPKQIMYAFGQVNAQACTDPQDQSTCKPTKLFTSLIWNF